MGVADIILRILNHAPLVTKGAELTSAEIDTGFIGIFTDVNTINNPINTPAYDNGTTYVGGVETLVSFSSKLWRFISATDKTGIAPGTDVTVWNEESINRLAHEDVNLVTVTRAALLALQIAGTIHPSRLYFISDRDIYVVGVTTTQVSLDGALLARNADYQNVGGNVLGVWTAAIDAGSPGLVANDIAIYNGLHWKSLTGVTTGATPPNDPINWVLLATTDSSYINEIDPIHYDLSNDVIIKRMDKRGNNIETENSFIDSSSPPQNPIDVFQWGNDSVVGNIVGDNAVLTCLNNLQSIKYNTIENADVISEMVTNDFLRNEIKSDVIDVSAVTSDFTDENKILTASLTILSADVLQLNSVEKQIVANPGAGRGAEGLTMSTKAIDRAGMVAYAANTGLQLKSDTAGSSQMADNRVLISTVTRTTKGAETVPGGATNTQVVENKALMIAVDTGDPTTGNFDIKIFITYRIINF